MHQTEDFCFPFFFSEKRQTINSTNGNYYAWFNLSRNWLVYCLLQQTFVQGLNPRILRMITFWLSFHLIVTFLARQTSSVTVACSVQCLQQRKMETREVLFSTFHWISRVICTYRDKTAADIFRYKTDNSLLRVDPLTGSKNQWFYMAYHVIAIGYVETGFFEVTETVSAHLREVPDLHTWRENEKVSALCDIILCGSLSGLRWVTKIDLQPCFLA